MIPITIALNFIRHILADNEEARSQLASHADETICIEAPLGPIYITIDKDGYPTQTMGADKFSLKIHLTPEVAINWLKDRELGFKGVKIEGDAHFASDLSRVLNKISWDYEEDLAKIFGDVLAHRMGKLLRGIAKWLKDSKEIIRSSVGEYLTEESKLLATKLRIELFSQDVDDLNDAVSRLEKRVALIAQKLNAKSDAGTLR
jgi:ubiquinone biosynthesis protein UbiJ